MIKKHTLSMLIIEDESDACEILHSLFSIKYPSAVITCAENGALGKKFILEQQPDIIVSDISLPDTDGITMLKEVRSHLVGSHIIVVTAHSNRLILDQCASAEIRIDLIPKPIDFARILASIDTYLAIYHSAHVPSPATETATSIAAATGLPGL